MCTKTISFTVKILYGLRSDTYNAGSLLTEFNFQNAVVLKGWLYCYKPLRCQSIFLNGKTSFRSCIDFGNFYTGYRTLWHLSILLHRYAGSILTNSITLEIKKRRLNFVYFIKVYARLSWTRGLNVFCL